jgi:hypothetical protein
MLNIKIIILSILCLSCKAQSRGHFQAVSQYFGITSGVVGGDYKFTGTEVNQLPSVSNVVISGTIQNGQTITITGTIVNNSNYPISTCTVKVYKSNDTIGTGEVLSATVTSVNITGTSVSATYVLTETGKYVCAELQANVAGGNTTSLISRSPYTLIVAP